MNFKKMFLIVFVVVILMIGLFFGYMLYGQKKILKTEISNIDFSDYPTGLYIGTFKGYRWTSTVEINIDEGKVVNIKVVSGPVFRLAELEDYIIKEVIDKQSLEIDTYAGATVSSKAILKAIENAFDK